MPVKTYNPGIVLFEPRITEPESIARDLVRQLGEENSALRKDRDALREVCRDIYRAWARGTPAELDKAIGEILGRVMEQK